MEEKYKILIVEDFPADILLAKREISKIFPSSVYHSCDNKNDFIDALNNFRPDAIVCDYQMPSFDGLSALKILMEINPSIPLIIFTGSINEDIAVECMKSGATDYVIKQNIKRLGLAVKGALEKRKLSIEKDIEHKKLIESEARFRNFFQNHTASLGIIDISSNKFMDANRSTLDLFGFNWIELSELTLNDILLWNEEETTQNIKLAAENKKNYFIANLKIPSLTHKTIEIYTTPINIQNKIYLYAIIHDITERRKAEEELEYTKALLDCAIEQVPIPMVLITTDNHIVKYFNKAAKEFLEVEDESSYLGRNFFEVNLTWQAFNDKGLPINQGDLPISKALNGEITFSKEYSLITKNKNKKFYISNAVPVYNKKQEQIGAFVILSEITQLKLLQEELKNKQQLLEFTLFCSQLGTWDWDIVSGKTSFNEKWAEMLEYNIDDLEQNLNTWEKLIHPDDKERVMKILQDHLDGNTEFYEAEQRLLTKSGSYKWILDRGKIIERDSYGHPLRALGTHMDIHKIKIEEENFRAYMNKKQSIQNSITKLAVSPFLTNGDLTNFVKLVCESVAEALNNERASVWFFNDSATELTCFNLFEKSKTVHSAGSKLSEEDFKDELQALKTSKYVDANDPFTDPRTKGYSDSYLIPKNITSMLDTSIKYGNKNLGVLCCEHVNQPHTWDQDEINYTIQIADQISICLLNKEKKQAENQVRKLSVAVEQSPVSIVITDLLGNIEYVNSKFSEISGYLPIEVIGKNPKFLKSGLTPPEIYAELWNTIKTNQTWRGEFINKKRNGEIFYESAVISPITDENGEAVRYIAIKEDITSKKQFEKELEKAKQKIEETDKLKTVFLQNMSHEIRTPLNGILGFSSLLQEKDISEIKIKRYTEIIRACGIQLLALITNILDISRLETGQETFIFRNVNIDQVIEDIKLTYSTVARNKKLNLLASTPDKTSPAMTKTDENKLKQILANLVDNALKFSDAGTVEFGYTKKGSSYEFFVKDEGIGISKENHLVIFERFRQEEPLVASPRGGTGLGLAICKQLVELLGGKIWVESEKGKGSTFYFTIPDIAIAYDVTEETFEDRQSKDINLKGKTILIVEDDETNMIFFQTVLGFTGATMISAINGKEAVDCIKKNHNIDLVLMDIKMPQMDGYQATKLIKDINPKIPIIAQTAYALIEDEKKILSLGFDAYISKPIEQNRLYDLIEKYIL